MRPAAWLAVVVLGLSQGAAAQPHRGGADGSAARRDGGPGGPPTSARREQIKKKIRALRAYTLTEELALDEQTAARLFPALSRYDDETDKLLEKRVDVQRRLRRADSLRDERAVERLIDEASANQRAFWKLEDKRFEELRKILTPVQTAKLLVVLPAFERRIQNQLRKAIVSRRTGPGAPDQHGDDDSDDDREPDEIAPRQVPSSQPRRREVPLAPRAAPTSAPGNTPPCTPSTQPCR
jgi:hypothetical protein